MLAITPDDVGYDRAIVALWPHGYVVREGDTFIADFRTHPKFAKRLYYAFRPVWWALHVWDWLVADRFVPQWSFGFDVLTAYPDPPAAPVTSCNGLTIRYTGGSGDSWANVRLLAGTHVQTFGPNYFARIVAHTEVDKWDWISRTVFLFDTSAIGSTKQVTAATFSLFANGGANTFGGAAQFNVYTSNPTSNTGVITTDYNIAKWGSTALSSALTFGTTFVIGAYNAFTLNASGLAAISKTGVSKLGTRSVNDADNVPPSWASAGNQAFNGYLADDAGLTRDPKLVVTYVIPNIVLEAVATVVVSVSALLSLPAPLVASAAIAVAATAALTTLVPLAASAALSIQAAAVITLPITLAALALVRFTATATIATGSDWQHHWDPSRNALVSVLGTE